MPFVLGLPRLLFQHLYTSLNLQCSDMEDTLYAAGILVYDLDENMPASYYNNHVK